MRRATGTGQGPAPVPGAPEPARMRAAAARRRAAASRIDGVIARRAWLGRLAVLLAAASTTCRAQSRRARLGWLAVGPATDPGVRTPQQLLFLEFMRQRGWSETRLMLEVRGPMPGKTLAEAASELVASKPDVLVSAGTPAVKILRDLTAEIPIVMAGTGDPVGTGLVASLARPGGNITGVSWQLRELIPKALSLLHEFVPHARRIDLVSQTQDPGHAFFAKVMIDAARSRGLACQAIQVGNADELVTTISASMADALLMLATGMIYSSAERIAAAAVRRGLPFAITGGPGREPTAAGILFCYSANHEETLRRAADCVDRILHGARPADVPVVQPARYDFVINMKTARAMGLAVPQALLLRADEVIE